MPKASIVLRVQPGLTLVLDVVTGFADTPHRLTARALKPLEVTQVCPESLSAQHLVDAGSRDEILLQFSLPFPGWIPTSLCDFFVPSVRVSLLQWGSF